MQQLSLVHHIISFVWFGVRRLPRVCARARVCAREVRGDCIQLEHVHFSGLHTQLFSAARHSVSLLLLHAVTVNLSLSTAHAAQCDLQTHLSTSRGRRVLDTLQTPHPGSLWLRARPRALCVLKTHQSHLYKSNGSQSGMLALSRTFPWRVWTHHSYTTYQWYLLFLSRMVWRQCLSFQSASHHAVVIRWD